MYMCMYVHVLLSLFVRFSSFLLILFLFLFLVSLSIFLLLSLSFSPFFLSFTGTFGNNEGHTFIVNYASRYVHVCLYMYLYLLSYNLAPCFSIHFLSLPLSLSLSLYCQLCFQVCTCMYVHVLVSPLLWFTCSSQFCSRGTWI